MLNVHVPKSIEEMKRMFDVLPEKIVADPELAERYEIPSSAHVPASLLINQVIHRKDSTSYQISYHYSHVRHDEPYVAFEDRASFCTLACAVDDQNDVVTSHMALVAPPPSEALSQRSQELVTAFREQIRQTLTPKYEVLVAGMDFDRNERKQAEVVHKRVMETFADAQHVQQQLSHNWKETNSVEDDRRWYSGILTLPPRLSVDKQLHIFVLNNKIKIDELIGMLL